MGDAVADDSKNILAVKFNQKSFIMADIRGIIANRSLDISGVMLEFFFDGNLTELRNPDGAILLHEFLEALQDTIRNGVREYFRRKMSVLGNEGKGYACLRDRKYPDDTVRYAGSSIEDAFRDAGCLLSFVAVRVSLSEECAECIGGIAFPEYFGMRSVGLKDPPMPKWLIGMGMVAIVMGVATVFAWAQILIYGNVLS